MKVKIEFDSNLSDDEIKIICRNDNQIINQVKDYVNTLSNINMPFYKNSQEYYLDINDIIFIETDDNSIRAHTINDVYLIKYKLYELEDVLPHYFIRVSKSTIININHLQSICINITSSSLIEFKDTYKQTYVSRFYLKNLKERLKENRNEKYQ